MKAVPKFLGPQLIVNVATRPHQNDFFKQTERFIIVGHYVADIKPVKFRLCY